MCKKILITSLSAILFVAGIVPHHSVVTAQGFDWTALVITEERDDAAEEAVSAIVDNDATNDNAAVAPKKKGGNGFVRALGAPFRALGRLFSGNKKSNQQARRTTEKDASKFETSIVTRIKDASVTSQPTSTTQGSAPSLPTTTEFDSHLQNGRALLVAGDVNSAIAELSSATSINPKSAEANNLLGIAYESKGLRDRALESLEVALHADENNAEYLSNLGYLRYKNGDYERATKYLKKAAKLSPGDARVWNNLGLVQCARGKFDDAYRSFALATGEFGARMSIAAQLQQRGQAKEAIKHLEKALGLSQNSIEVLSRLVSLYELTGRATDAETARRSLLALKTFAEANK